VLQDGLDQTLLTAAKRTATYLRARLGSDPTSAIDLDGMAFSDVKRVSFDHALGYGVELFERPNAGGEDTINVSQNLSFGEDDATWVSTYVSVERSVGRFADDGVPEVWITMPFTGAAEPGDAASESALDHYLRVEHQPLLFRRGDVEARAARRRELPARD
jgi:hypothetical protein